MNKLLTDVGAAEYLVRELEYAGFFRTADPMDINRAIVYMLPLIDNLVSRGLLRLDDEALKVCFKESYEVSRRLDARTCAATAFGNIPVDPMAQPRASLAYLNECPQSDFDAYLGLMSASITAEVNDYPPVRQLTPEEARLAEQVFLNMLRAYREEDPVKGSRTIEVLAAPQNFSYAEQCDAALDYLKLALKVQGRAGSLLRLYLIGSGIAN